MYFLINKNSRFIYLKLKEMITRSLSTRILLLIKKSLEEPSTVLMFLSIEELG